MCSGLLRNVRERGQADRIFLSGKWIWGYSIAKIHYYLITCRTNHAIFFFFIFQRNKYLHLVYIYSSFIVHMYKCTYICTYVHNVRVRLDGGWERNGCHVKLADLIVFFLRRLRQLLTIHRK